MKLNFVHKKSEPTTSSTDKGSKDLVRFPIIIWQMEQFAKQYSR